MVKVSEKFRNNPISRYLDFPLICFTRPSSSSLIYFTTDRLDVEFSNGRLRAVLTPSSWSVSHRPAAVGPMVISIALAISKALEKLLSKILAAI